MLEAEIRRCPASGLGKGGSSQCPRGSAVPLGNEAPWAMARRGQASWADGHGAGTCLLPRLAPDPLLSLSAADVPSSPANLPTPKARARPESERRQHGDTTVEQFAFDGFSTIRFARKCGRASLPVSVPSRPGSSRAARVRFCLPSDSVLRTGDICGPPESFQGRPWRPAKLWSFLFPREIQTRVNFHHNLRTSPVMSQDRAGGQQPQRMDTRPEGRRTAWTGRKLGGLLLPLKMALFLSDSNSRNSREHS